MEFERQNAARIIEVWPEELARTASLLKAPGEPRVSRNPALSQACIGRAAWWVEFLSVCKCEYHSSLVWSLMIIWERCT